MTIVNEVISEEDYEKYNLKKLDERLSWSSPNGCWAIDHERDIWIRKYYTPIDRDNNGVEIGPTQWDYYWHSKNLIIEVYSSSLPNTIKEGREYDSNFYEIVSIILPINLKPKQDEILSELCELFEVYQFLLFGKHPSLPPLNQVDATSCQFIYQ